MGRWTKKYLVTRRWERKYHLKNLWYREERITRKGTNGEELQSPELRRHRSIDQDVRPEEAKRGEKKRHKFRSDQKHTLLTSF